MDRSIHDPGKQRLSEGLSSDGKVIHSAAFRSGPKATGMASGQPEVTIKPSCFDSYPLVRPAIYNFVLVDFRTELMFGRQPKLRLNLRIVDIGEYFEVVLPRWYNVKRLISKVGKNGRFKPPETGDFVLEYLTLFPTMPIKRLDRISMRPFRGCVIKGRVETVSRNARQRKLPGPLQYSVVRELLEVGA